MESAFSKVYDSTSITIEAFRTFPLQIDRLDELELALALSDPAGLSLEFGVYKGGSLRYLAQRNPARRFFGFDSFEGLPEPWVRSDTSVYQAGHFKLPALPDMPENATLVKGFFEDSLGPWLEKNPGKVSFIHVDPDLYSAAKYVLTALYERMTDPVIIVFDELCDWLDSGKYPNWPEGEWRALREFLAETGCSFRIISRSIKYEAAIEVYKSAPPPYDPSRMEKVLAWLAAEGQGGGDPGNLVTRIAAAQGGLSSTLRNGPAALFKRRELAKAVSLIDRLLAAQLSPADTESAAPGWRKLKFSALMKMNRPEAAQDYGRTIVDDLSGDTDFLKSFAVLSVKSGNYQDAVNTIARIPAGAMTPELTALATESATLNLIRPEFRRIGYSSLLIQQLIDAYDFRTVLDIGSGSGAQAAALRQAGRVVTELDYGKSPYFERRPDGGALIVGDFMTVDIAEPYDCVLASHVLEHQLNVQAFLRKVHTILPEGGIFAVSVPPLKHKIVGGHLTLWNAGLLMYNLVVAGFDCKDIWLRKYSNNISAILRKRTVPKLDLVFDTGDIDRISPYLPDGLREGFNGEIMAIN